MSMQQASVSTLHTRCARWSHIGKRSTNGGLYRKVAVAQDSRNLLRSMWF